MGYWVYTDDYPGSGGGNGPDWKERLGCLAAFAVFCAGVYLCVKFGLGNVASIGFLLLMAALMLYVIISSGFDRTVLLCGAIGFLVGLLFSGLLVGFIFAGGAMSVCNYILYKDD